MEAAWIQSVVKIGLGCVTVLFSSQLVSRIFKAKAKVHSLNIAHWLESKDFLYFFLPEAITFQNSGNTFCPLYSAFQLVNYHCMFFSSSLIDLSIHLDLSLNLTALLPVFRKPYKNCLVWGTWTSSPALIPVTKGHSWPYIQERPCSLENLSSHYFLHLYLQLLSHYLGTQDKSQSMALGHSTK